MEANWLSKGSVAGNALRKAITSEIETSLRARIASGEWAQSGRLPTERELAMEYGVARNTLRKAIDAIVADGTVDRHVGRGMFVNGEANELAEIIQRVTGVSPADLMTVRLLVEPQAAAMAATNASTSDIDAIAEAHRFATDAQETDPFEKWDTEFHQRIFMAARNELLMGFHDILRVIRSRNAWIELKRKTFSENRRLNYCEHHGDIVRALYNRDAAGAARAMQAHMEAIQLTLFGHV